MTSMMLSLIMFRIERRSTAMVCIWLRMATISLFAAARYAFWSSISFSCCLIASSWSWIWMA